MIKTFDDLSKKLEKDGRSTSVLNDKLLIVQKKEDSSFKEIEVDQAWYWLTGYLFCLIDADYISDEEWENLHNLSLDMMYK